MNKTLTAIAEDIRKNKQSQFIRFLDGSPTFVTLYSISNLETTVEVGTRDVATYVGPDSPVRYNKVLEFPFFGFGTIENTIQWDEIEGSYNEFETSILSVPTDLEINEGDMIVYPPLPDVLFTVTNIEDHNIITKGYKEVTIAIIRDGGQIPLIENQVVDIYRAVYNNIGTEDKVIIRNDDFIDALELEEKYRFIASEYIRRYMDKSYSSLLELSKDSNEFTVLDPMLHIFCVRNGIITGDDLLEELYFFDDSNLYNRSEKERYFTSMYGRFEKMLFKTDLEVTKYGWYKYVDIIYDMTGNMSSTQRVVKVDKYSDTGGDGWKELIPETMRVNILGTPTNAIEKCISSFIKEGFTPDALFSILNTDNVYDEIISDESNHMYFTIPLVLYVIRYALKVLLSKN